MRRVELERDREVVDLGDARGGEHAAEGRAGLRRRIGEQPVVRRDDVVGRHRLAVGELDALAELVRPLAAGRVRLPADGQLGRERQVRPVAVEELTGDAAQLQRGGLLVRPRLQRAVRDGRQADAETPAGLAAGLLRERYRSLACGQQGARDHRRRKPEHRRALDESGAIALAGEEVVDHRVLRVGRLCAPGLEAPAGLSIHALFPPNGGRCEVRRAMVRRSWPARQLRRERGVMPAARRLVK